MSWPRTSSSARPDRRRHAGPGRPGRGRRAHPGRAPGAGQYAPRRV